MSSLFSGIFDQGDRIQMASLEHRLKRSQVINANIANSEVPGYRALGYDFEKQLQEVSELDSKSSLRTLSNKHYKTENVQANGKMDPDVIVRPTESVGSDGNTVDMDKEMALFAENQIAFRSAVETLNRKIGMIRYAINGGR